jgi:molecular chaperone GrpE
MVEEMTAADAEAPGDGARPKSRKRRVPWKKRALSLKSLLDDVAREAAENKEKWLRSAAEFDNYRKRMIRQQEDMRKTAAEALLRECVEVLDNLERAVEASREASDSNALREGVELVRLQMRDVLERAGVSPIASVGEQFDPEVHEAVMVAPAEGAEPGTVVAELGRGYRLHDRVLRPAKVSVAR